MASCKAIVPLLAQGNPKTTTTAALSLAAMDTETAAQEMVDAHAGEALMVILKRNETQESVQAAMKLIINASCWECMRDHLVAQGIIELLCERLNHDVKLLRGKSRTLVAGLTKGTSHGDVNELVLLALRNLTATPQSAGRALKTLKDTVLEVFLFTVQDQLTKGGEKQADTTTSESAINHILPNLGMDEHAIERLEKTSPALWDILNAGLLSCLEHLDERRAAGMCTLLAFVKNTGLALCEGNDDNAGVLGERVLAGPGRAMLGSILKLIVPKNPTFRPDEVERLKLVGIEYAEPSGSIEKPLADGELLALAVEVLLSCAGGRAGREHLRSIGTYPVLRELDNGFVASDRDAALRALIDLLIGDEEGTLVPASPFGHIRGADEPLPGLD